MNKKGNVVDILTSVRFLLIVGISAIFLLTISNEFRSEFNAANENSSVSSGFARDTYTEFNTNLITSIDYGILFFAAGFILFSFIMARIIPTNNAYYVLALIFIVFIWFVAIIAESFYDKFAESSAYITEMVASMKFTPLILDNMLYYALIYTFLVGIAMFTKGDRV